MVFIHDCSEECTKYKLDLFEVSPTQTSLEKARLLRCLHFPLLQRLHLWIFHSWEWGRLHRSEHPAIPLQDCKIWRVQPPRPWSRGSCNLSTDKLLLNGADVKKNQANVHQRQICMMTFPAAGSCKLVITSVSHVCEDGSGAWSAFGACWGTTANAKYPVDQVCIKAFSTLPGSPNLAGKFVSGIATQTCYCVCR